MRTILAGKFLRRKNTQNSNSMPWNPLQHDEHEYLPKGPLSCEDFQKGHSKDLFLALSRKSSQEGVHEHTTMSCPETSADGLVVGGGVGASDVFHWEKILALFIAHSLAALARGGGSAAAVAERWLRTARRRQRGGSSVEAAAVVEARQRDVGGSLVAVRWQWQHQRWGRQGNSVTSADRDISRS